jgi:CRISPR-associated protein Cmr2
VSSQLLLVSLGPIQDFIASARRCQDLWYGSWLLSDLARATAETLESSGAATLIFPGALGNDKANVANKILARVAGTADDAARLAGAAEQAMRKRLKEASDEAFARIFEDPLFHREVADKQLDDLIEFAWVSVPLVEETEYAAARDRAEQALASVKNTRAWGPVSWTAGQVGVPKSSLDGLRESVLDEKLYSHVTSGHLSGESVRRKFGVRGIERLCAVGLLKRLGAELGTSNGQRRRRPVFHSTSHLAAAPLLMALESKPGAARAFAEYCEALTSLGLDLERFRVRFGVTERAAFRNPFDEKITLAPRVFPNDLDGHLLFEDRLEEAFEEGGPNVVAKDLKKLIDLAKQSLRKALHALGQPPKYYALLLADGDNMGAAIDALSTHGSLASHQALSRALDSFAAGAGKTVASHGGSLIYSGGDDVLAMLPLHGAVACARALHDDFAKAVATPLDTLPAEKRPSLSVGLAIVHHLEPFGEARAWAKKAEAKAKGYREDEGTEQLRKDALAIILVPRSGGEVEVVDSWSHAPDVNLWRWVQMLGTEAVSSKAAHDLLEAIEPLRVGLDLAQRKALGPVAVALAKRVLSAKRERGGGASVDPKFREELEERFTAAVDPFAEVERLANELLVAKALLDGFFAAFGRPPAERARRGEAQAEVQP